MKAGFSSWRMRTRLELRLQDRLDDAIGLFKLDHGSPPHSGASLEHDPETWEPVFGKGHAPARMKS
jgi:hypothetical protein